MSKGFITICLILLLSLLAACGVKYNAQDQMQQFTQETGLQEISLPDKEGTYLGRTFNGREVLFTTQMGNVWGRFAARIAIGELRSFLSNGNYRGSVTGSQLDRLLSRAIGQPLTIIVITKHAKPETARLDIITRVSTIRSPDPQPKIHSVGLNTGSIYSADTAFADRVNNDEKLLDKISDLYSPYFRVDENAVTYIYSGPETDLSAMIREHGSYGKYILSVMEISSRLADLA